MRRWFMNLPVAYKLLSGIGTIPLLLIGMIIMDIFLSTQQIAPVSSSASLPSMTSESIESIRTNALSHMLLIGVFIIILGAGVAVIIARTITRPLQQVRKAAHIASSWQIELAKGLEALAQGNWSISMPQRSIPSFYESRDEIGQMAQSVHTIITKVHSMSNIYESTREELEGLYMRIQEQNTILSVANNHLNTLATTDPLTGLPNHRAIMDKIDEEIAECQNSQQNCAIIFVDVDHFKHINDTWGHGTGDAVLRFVGEQLRACVREGDYVGRYGGEEFAILLTDIEQHEAFEMAERLRASIAEQPYYEEKEEASIVVTASFGLAVYPLDGITKKELIEMADAAMYYAKHSGRNRVCLPDEENLAVQNTHEMQATFQHAEHNIVQVLATAEQLHDQETHAHALRMLSLAETITRALGRSEEEVLLIRLAAQLHDIGKIGIPDAILRKPGPLTEQEWSVMRSHPGMSQQILAQAGGRFELVSHIAVAHHERWDGQGYPYGLLREEIPLGARILAVVDSYDAMISSRPYRKALSEERAREELIRCKGGQYDPEVVDTFLRILQEKEQQGNAFTPLVAEKIDAKEQTAEQTLLVPGHSIDQIHRV